MLPRDWGKVWFRVTGERKGRQGPRGVDSQGSEETSILKILLLKRTMQWSNVMKGIKQMVENNSAYGS